MTAAPAKALTTDEAGPAGAPFVSLVVATLGAADGLEPLLESLTLQQAPPPFEVIVVDQNGDDRLALLVERFRDRLSIVHERVDFRGASLARNHGANVARGRWVGFPDDDCQLRPDALRQMHEAASASGLPIVSGRTIEPDGKASVLRWAAEAGRFGRWSMFRCVTECTLFVDRTVFASAGGFDPSFGPGAPYPAAEGLDLINRLLGPSGQGYFSPRIEFVHPSKVPPWNEWAVDRFRQYAIGDGALIAKSRSLPLLYWGGRTALSALVKLIARDPLRRAAYAARLHGLATGLARYHRSARR